MKQHAKLTQNPKLFPVHVVDFLKKNSKPHQSVTFHRIGLKFVLKIQDTISKTWQYIFTEVVGLRNGYSHQILPVFHFLATKCWVCIYVVLSHLETYLVLLK